MKRWYNVAWILLLPLGAGAQMAQYEAGLSAYTDGRYDQAIASLETLVSAEPAYYQPGQGSAAYWLAHLYQITDQPDAAWEVIEWGLNMMYEAGMFDVLLADLFIQEVYGHEDTAFYESGEALYLQVLAQFDAGLSGKELEVARKHVHQAVLILPDNRRAQLIDDSRPNQLAFYDGAGEQMAAWWRSKDPFPGTAWNERLQEHLERVYYAEEHFGVRSRPSRVDDRGEVYIQLGPPRARSRVDVNMQEINLELTRRGLRLPGAFLLPPNEFWEYRHIDEDIHFLFVLRNTRYRMAEPDDLIPDELKQSNRRSEDDPSIDILAFGLLSAWQEVFTDLALYHPYYEEHLNAIEAMNFDRLYTAGGVRPSSMIGATRRQFQATQRIAEQDREEAMPDDYTRLFEGIAPLAVETRTARFRNPDGTTRVEIYWSHRPTSLALDGGTRDALTEEGYEVFDRYFIHFNGVQKGITYQPESTLEEQYVALDLPLDTDQSVPVQKAVFEAVGGPMFHVGLQWDQYAIAEPYSTEEEIVLGPRMKVGAYRTDSLAILPADAGQLSASDLLPTYVADEEALIAAANPATAMTPYPFITITPETRLALYFEVYNLAFGTDDQTHYVVDYEIRRKEGSGFLSLRGSRENRITASTPYVGQTRSENNYILLELESWEGEGELDIEVTIRDETTGQQVTRNIEFRLADPNKE